MDDLLVVLNSAEVVSNFSEKNKIFPKKVSQPHRYEGVQIGSPAGQYIMNKTLWSLYRGGYIQM